MKKYYLIFIFLLIIIIITIIGSHLFSGNISVSKEPDIATTQIELEKRFLSYGYTLDNPNIIINPYEISPLTALVIFETNEKETPTIIIKGKNNEIDYTYTLNPNVNHFIPIYYLYPDYENKVIVKCGYFEKELTIKTNPLPEDINDYPSYKDDYNNIRWYLTKKYTGNMTKLANNNYLIGSDKLDENNHSISVLEINLLGKVYYEYLLENSYYGLTTTYKDNILVLSSNLLELDRQTMKIINEYEINDNYDYMTTIDDLVILQNEDKTIAINHDTKEVIDYSKVTPVNSSLVAKNLNIYPKVTLGKLKETKQTSKKISLFNYKEYQDALDIIKEPHRLVIKTNTNEDTYIILDQFLDKRTYQVKDNLLYINDTNLKGTYTIYIKIGKKIYNTNYYIKY